MLMQWRPISLTASVIGISRQSSSQTASLEHLVVENQRVQHRQGHDNQPQHGLVDKNPPVHEVDHQISLVHRVVNVLQLFISLH